MPMPGPMSCHWRRSLGLPSASLGYHRSGTDTLRPSSSSTMSASSVTRTRLAAGASVAGLEVVMPRLPVRAALQNGRTHLADSASFPRTPLRGCRMATVARFGGKRPDPFLRTHLIRSLRQRAGRQAACRRCATERTALLARHVKRFRQLDVGAERLVPNAAFWIPPLGSLDLAPKIGIAVLVPM